MYRGQTPRLTPQMSMVVICENFGWTYQQYKRQPLWFIELIKQKMKADSKRQKRQQRKNGNL